MNTKPSTSSRRRTLTLLGVAIILYFFANFQRTVIPGTIFSELQSDLNLTASQVTGLGAVFMYVYAVSQLFVGVLVDRFGGFRVITVGGVLFCLGSMLFPFGNSALVLYVSRFLVGMGASSIYLSLVQETKNAFPRNFALAIGTALFLGYAGSITANAPFIALIRTISWRTALIGIGGLTSIFFLLFILLRFIQLLPAGNPSVKFRISAFRPAVVKKHNWAVFLLTSLAFAIYYTLQTVLGKKFLQDYCTMDAMQAGWVLTMTGAIAAVSSFIWPFLSKLCGNRRRPFLWFNAGGTFFCCAGIVTAMLCDCHAQWYFSGLFLLLTFCSNMTPIFLGILNETNPSETLGVCTSFSNFLSYLLVALLGNLSGIVMDRFDFIIVHGEKVYGTAPYLVIFSFFTLLTLICLWSALRLKESFGKPIEVQ